MNLGETLKLSQSENTSQIVPQIQQIIVKSSQNNQQMQISQIAQNSYKIENIEQIEVNQSKQFCINIKININQPLLVTYECQQNLNCFIKPLTDIIEQNIHQIKINVIGSEIGSSQLFLNIKNDQQIIMKLCIEFQVIEKEMPIKTILSSQFQFQPQEESFLKTNYQMEQQQSVFPQSIIQQSGQFIQSKVQQTQQQIQQQQTQNIEKQQENTSQENNMKEQQQNQQVIVSKYQEINNQNEQEEKEERTKQESIEIQEQNVEHQDMQLKQDQLQQTQLTTKQLSNIQLAQQINNQEFSAQTSFVLKQKPKKSYPHIIKILPEEIIFTQFQTQQILRVRNVSDQNLQVNILLSSIKNTSMNVQSPVKDCPLKIQTNKNFQLNQCKDPQTDIQAQNVIINYIPQYQPCTYQYKLIIQVKTEFQTKMYQVPIIIFQYNCHINCSIKDNMLIIQNDGDVDAWVQINCLQQDQNKHLISSKVNYIQKDFIELKTKQTQQIIINKQSQFQQNQFIKIKYGNNILYQLMQEQQHQNNYEQQQQLKKLNIQQDLSQLNHKEMQTIILNCKN